LVCEYGSGFGTTLGNKCAGRGKRISEEDCFLEQFPHHSSVSTMLLVVLCNEVIENKFKVAAFLMSNVAVIYTFCIFLNQIIFKITDSL